MALSSKQTSSSSASPRRSRPTKRTSASASRAGISPSRGRLSSHGSPATQSHPARSHPTKRSGTRRGSSPGFSESSLGLQRILRTGSGTRYEKPTDGPHTTVRAGRPTSRLTYDGESGKKSSRRFNFGALLGAFSFNPFLLVGGALSLGCILLLVYLVLLFAPIFVIQAIDVSPTDHLSAETIAQLADVNAGTTLFTYDKETITSNVMRNPWVASVDISREFPDTLKIEVTERKVGYLVVMGSGSVCWYLGEDGIWIEPASLDTTDGLSTGDAARARAEELGCILVTDAPSTTDPVAGEQATDSVIRAILTYVSEFPEELSSQITQFSASGDASLSCALNNGVTILLGEASSISSKATVILKLLEEYEDQITYINVRTPSNPSFRRIS